MLVPVVQVGVVRMRVHQRCVPVVVRVRLTPVPAEIVSVPVMRVVGVRMLVIHRFVRMLVRMVLGHVQPYAGGHQCRGDSERSVWAFAEQRQR